MWLALRIAAAGRIVVVHVVMTVGLSTVFPTWERDLLDRLFRFLKNDVVVLDDGYSSVESKGSKLSGHSSACVEGWSVGYVPWLFQ